jgi:hypothetical protein
MDPATEQELLNKVWATFTQPKSFTSVELDFLRSNIKRLAHYNDRTQSVAQTRVAVELLDAIQRFDKASGELVTTTNKLTRRILILTWVMIGIGVLGAVASAWPYLTWWLQHVI